MAVFKGDRFIADDWRTLAPEEEPPLDGKVIIGLRYWLTARAELPADRAIGLLIEPGKDIQAIGADLPRFALIAVAFPKFTDGRGYSYARQIRDHGFHGELRAVGDILFDQLQFLARCGFDSFEITDAATTRLLLTGCRPHLDMFYQPGLPSEVKEPTRPWARRTQP